MVKAFLRREKNNEKPDTRVRDWSVAKAIEHILSMVAFHRGEITVLNMSCVEVVTPIPFDNGRIKGIKGSAPFICECAWL